VAQGRKAECFRPSVLLRVTYAQSIASFERRGSRQASRKELVLYWARHDYGTRAHMRTGNLAVVMRTMGHRGVKTAMRYQHPELEVVRAALDYGTPNDVAIARA
jgi:hypothetical protein